MGWMAMMPMIISAVGALASQSGGKEGEYNKLETMTPEQRNMLNSLMKQLGSSGQIGQGGQQGTGYMQQMLDPSSEAYKKFEQPYMNQFNQETVPGLAERFAGMGGGMGGGTSSSGFGQALSSAGSNLQSQLAALKTGMQGQAANSLMQQFQNMMGQGLGAQAYGYSHQPASPGMFANMAGPMAKFAGNWANNNWGSSNSPNISATAYGSEGG
jgi:hypothetical protein